jgi:hypothetical protein
MKKPLIFTWTLIFLLLVAPTSNASIRLIPSIDSPQDAAEVAVLIPEAGVGLSMLNYNPATNSASFAVVKNGMVEDFLHRDNVVVGEDLELIPDCMTAVIETTADSVTFAISCSHPYVVLVANSIDYNLSQGFVDYLDDKGVQVIRASASDFEGYKDADNIIILGGPDALDGVGNITSQVLDEEEQEFLRAEGNRDMFIRGNPWYPKYSDKTVTVLAGSDRFETQKAVSENQHNSLFDRF